MYFITALTGLNFLYDSRCFGYYLNKEEAITAVQENRCDLNEGIYNYIVIEKIGKGIHSITEEETWFEWFQTGEYLGEGHWEQIAKPQDTEHSETEHFINYAIG